MTDKELDAEVEAVLQELKSHEGKPLPPETREKAIALAKKISESPSGYEWDPFANGGKGAYKD